MAEPRFDSWKQTDNRHPEEIALAEADKIYSEYGIKGKPKESERTPKKQSLADKLHEHADVTGINADDLFADIDIKRDALRNIMGYKSLKGYKSLDEASNQAIAHVYRKTYYSSHIK